MATRIAIFDHSPNFLVLYDRNLTKRGYEVFTFTEELTTFKDVEAVEPDIVIVASVSGIDKQTHILIRQIKTHPRFHAIPIIIATHDLEYQPDALSDLSGIYVSHNPFDVEQLLSYIQQATKT